MKKLRILTIILYCFFLASSVIAQYRPTWFDKVGVYRDWMPREWAIEFDNKIRNSGLPAWGAGINFWPGGRDFLIEDIQYVRNQNKIYVANTSFSSIPIQDTIYCSINIDSIAGRNIKGEIAISGNLIQASLFHPGWEYLKKDHIKTIIDIGVDGISFDEADFAIENTFDAYTMRVFREYLKNKYSPDVLKIKFDISDISNFNYAEWIRAHGLIDTWDYMPYDGLKQEYWVFWKIGQRDLFRKFVEYIKEYSLQKYGREIPVSCNALVRANSHFFMYFDMIDYFAFELQYYFGKRSQPDLHTRWLPYDFMATANKICRSVKNAPILPLVEIGGVDVLNIPLYTENLIKLIFADAYASQGQAHLEHKFAGELNGSLQAHVVAYNYDIAGKWSNFIYNNPTLFEYLTYNPNCGLLYSMSSLSTKYEHIGGWPIKSFYGTAQFLIDNSIPFDVIFAPDTRFSTLPDISLEKLQNYEIVILPNTISLNDHQVQAILEYANNGGTIIAYGDIGTETESGEIASRPELQGLQESNGVKNIGLGKFVYFKEQRSFGNEFGTFYWAYPEQTKLEFYNFIKPYINPELQISNADNVCGFIYNLINNTIIHLVNYDYNIPSDQFFLKENFSVNIQIDTSKFWEAVYVSPDFLGQQVLPTTIDNGYVSATIPKLEAYGIVILQENQTEPQISSRTPETNVTIIAGDSLQFSVQAMDPDGNPLFYQWYINGLIDSMGTDSTYLFRTARTFAGIDTVTVNVSDGSHTISTYWLVTVQRYISPKVLFDEAHNEYNTILFDRAKQISPDSPEGVYLGILVSKMNSDYQIDSFASGRLTPNILQNYNILILAVPCTEFYPEEISAVLQFVNNGGGLFFFGDWFLDSGIINPFLERFGIDFINEVVNEPGLSGQNYGNILISDFITHDALNKNPQFQMNWGGSFAVTSSAIGLGYTDNTAWRDLNRNQIKDGNEEIGPFVIMCASEVGNGRIICVSDNTFTDTHIASEQSQNDQLFLSAMRWLTEGVNQIIYIADFSLFSPKNNIIITDLTPKLSWEQPTGVENQEITFDLYFSTDGNFEPSQTQIIARLDTNIYIFSDSLNDTTTYYWKVLAKHPWGYEKWSSETWNFTIKTDAVPPYFTDWDSDPIDLTDSTKTPFRIFVTVIDTGKGFDDSIIPQLSFKVGDKGYSEWFNMEKVKKNSGKLSKQTGVKDKFGFDKTPKINQRKTELETLLSTTMDSIRCYYDISVSDSGWQDHGGDTLFYKVRCKDVYKNLGMSKEQEEIIEEIVTGIVDADSKIPTQYELMQNYPNPFNPQTTIRFGLPQKDNVTIKIYDILGREVKTLVEKDFQAGWYTVTWDGANYGGRKVASGLYFYVMEAGDFVKVRKALFLK